MILKLCGLAVGIALLLFAIFWIVWGAYWARINDYLSGRRP